MRIDEDVADELELKRERVKRPSRVRDLIAFQVLEEQFGLVWARIWDDILAWRKMAVYMALFFMGKNEPQGRKHSLSGFWIGVQTEAHLGTESNEKNTCRGCLRFVMQALT